DVSDEGRTKLCERLDLQPRRRQLPRALGQLGKTTDAATCLVEHPQRLHQPLLNRSRSGPPIIRVGGDCNRKLTISDEIGEFSRRRQRLLIAFRPCDLSNPPQVSTVSSAGDDMPDFERQYWGVSVLEDQTRRGDLYVDQRRVSLWQ